MANEKILNTRIQLKYDSYQNWVEKNPTLLSGEVAIAYLPPRPEVEHTNPAPAAVASATLIKVGPGQFNTLPWVSATAADVYAWAKQATLPITRSADDGETAGNVISSISWDAENNKIVYTTASVATSEGMADLQEAIETIQQDIADNRNDWAEKTVDTNTDTQYRFDTNGDKLVVYKTLYTLGVAGAEEKVGEYEFLTAEEVATTLQNYYTKTEINTMVDGKLHTQSEIEGYIDSALSAVSGTDAITGITTLVEYVNTHGSDLAAITKEIYGDSGKVGDDPSRIDTAVSNAASAVETANNASGVANSASGVADEAKELAQSAKETAETAQNSASASAAAASESASEASSAKDDAAASAAAALASENSVNSTRGEVEQLRDDVVGFKDDAEEAAYNAGVAQTNAETARDEAVQAKTAAEAAQAAANADAATASAKATAASNSAEAAEAAKQAALDSNTSATAIANEAKNTADAAKTASDAATEAVAGLHAIATSGSLYDAQEVNSDANSTKYFVFYCGTASELV